MRKLRNQVMPYEWGSRTAIAALSGRPVPSAGPEAELWIGAHVMAPSVVEGGGLTLRETIARNPDEELGSSVRRQFGDRLPFLLKVLAADVPLSLQAHPDRDQAKAGYAREEALGIARDARQRCYRDTNHKPEVLCALGPFEALCGFRPREQSLEAVRRLAVARLDEVTEPLRVVAGRDGLRAAFTALLSLEREDARRLVHEVAEACRREASRSSSDRALFEWVARLAELHPGDSCVVASLFLNFLRLESGEALSLGAGSLHTYLGGVGIELMASSDNVLRAGLTTKHVNADELVAILDFRETAAGPVATRTLSPEETEYVTGTEDFRLSRIELKDGGYRPERRGPELILCASGSVRVTDSAAPLELASGESAFVGAREGDYGLRGNAVLFRATVGSVSANR